MTLQEAITKIRKELNQKYPGYDTYQPKERRVLCAAYMCDVYKVHEIGSSNTGEWVNIFLRAAGLGPGNPWCAAFLTFCSMVARAWYPDEGPGAVVNWKREGKKLAKAGRGDIVLKMFSSFTGHIGLCVSAAGSQMSTIEGNTQSGISGNQRDGGAIYRRQRKGFFDIVRAG